MSEGGGGPARSPDAALLDKIEQLSLLRSLGDRLARARDFGSACRTLVQVVWEEVSAETVAYLSVDSERRVCRLEAAAPDDGDAERADDVALTTAPLPTLLAAAHPVVLHELSGLARLVPLPPPTRRSGAVVVGAPMRVRGATAGVLLVTTRDAGGDLEESRRLLALVASSAALALDAARDHQREEFLATLRHDINNPINAALGYAEMIIDGLQAERVEHLLPLASSMIGSLKSVADLVSNYLHLAAIDRGTPSLRLDAIDLGAVTAEIIDRLRPSAGGRTITLERPDPLPPVRADRRQMGRVITNLVDNALKYTPPAAQVRVSVGADDTGVEVRVADTGFGIAREDLPRLFTKYGRVDSNRGIPGTGLGLYICKAIVEAHGGTITLESAAGRGSIFTVRLPRSAT